MLFALPNYNTYFLKIFIREVVIIFLNSCVVIILMNFVGILSFILPITGLLLRFLVLRAPFITTTFIFLFYSLERFLCHQTPSRTPRFLLSFINIVEGLRFLLRFLTLSLRLIGNIICSHCLISIIDGSNFIFLLVLLLLHMDLMVCVIQRIVPILLFKSYYQETL